MPNTKISYKNREKMSRDYRCCRLLFDDKIIEMKAIEMKMNPNEFRNKKC